MHTNFYVHLMDSMFQVYNCQLLLHYNIMIAIQVNCILFQA